MASLTGIAAITIRSMVLLAMAPLLASQESTQIDYTHEYTFNQSRAVVVDGSTETIYAGSSGGVFVLDSSDPSAPVLAAGVANELRTGGFVRDLALTDDHLYVASHKAGLTRFRRGTTDPQPEWRLGRGTDISGVLPGLGLLNNTDGWAVTVPVRIGEFDLVFLGTNDEYYSHDGEGGGTLHLVHADAGSGTPDNPDVIASLSLGAPIHTLASMVDGSDVILLIGTECREDNGDPASLIRMEFPGAATTLPTAFPSASSWDVWPPPSSSLGPRFIRDITIDESSQHAYVAAFTEGVYKFDIASGLTEITGGSGNWPITAHHGSVANANAVQFVDSAIGSVLVVGLGPRHEVESTVWGECTALTPCDSEYANLATDFGVQLFDVAGTDPVLIEELLNGAGGPPTMALAVSAYEDSSGDLVIAAASLQKGLVVNTYTPSTGRLMERAVWGLGNSIPVGQFDDILRLGDTLYVASENSLVGFDVTPGTGGGPAGTLFSAPAEVESGVAVVLAGFEEDGDFPAVVFASALTGGVVIYQVSLTGDQSLIEKKGMFEATESDPREGPEILARTYSVAALPPSETPDGYPWVIALNTQDGATSLDSQSCPTDASNGSIRVYRVETDGGSPPQVNPGTIFEFTNGQAPPNNGPGGYVVDPCELPVGAFVGGVARVDGNDVHIYAGYSPRIYDGDPNDPLSQPDAGLFYLTLTYDPATESLSRTSVSQVVAFPDALDARSGLVEFGPGTGVVSAALGCNGVATFLESGSLLSKYPATGLAPSAFMDVEAGEDGNLYCTTMDGRLWVFDPTNMAVPLAIFETPGQGAFLEGATSTGSGSPPPPAFYLSDFRTGVHRVQLQSIPGS